MEIALTETDALVILLCGTIALVIIAELLFRE